MAAKTFDDYAEDYEGTVERAIGFARIEHDLFLKAKAQALSAVLGAGGDPARSDILDVGCGNGFLDRHLQPHVRSLHGADVSEEMIKQARLANPSGNYRAYDGARLPYEDAQFDMAFSVCTFHHVNPEERPRLTTEMTRVVRPGGWVAIVEHNPRNPLTRWVVARCDLDEDAILLDRREAEALLGEAGLGAVTTRFLLFAPTLTPLWLRAERRLARVPLGAQYVTTAVKRPG